VGYDLRKVCLWLSLGRWEKECCVCFQKITGFMKVPHHLNSILSSKRERERESERERER